MVQTRAQSKTTRPKATDSTKSVSKKPATKPAARAVAKKVTDPKPTEEDAAKPQVKKAKVATKPPVKSTIKATSEKKETKSASEPKEVKTRVRKPPVEPRQPTIRVKSASQVAFEKKTDIATASKQSSSKSAATAPKKSALKATIDGSKPTSKPLGKPIKPTRPRQQTTKSNTVPVKPIQNPSTAKEQTPELAQSQSLSTLSPIKALGSPIKPPGSAKPQSRAIDAPIRGTPLNFHKAAAQLSQMSTSVNNPFQEPEDTDQFTRSLCLSPSKSIGTPVRNKQFMRHAATAKPAKRSAPFSPWKPSSAGGVKRFKLDMTPSTLGPKKTVSFDGVPASPSPLHRQLPRLSEAQESEIAVDLSESTESLDPTPLPLSEVLNVQLTPDPTEELQISKAVLKNVTCYVDVWGSDGGNANQYFAPLLEELGARIVENFTEDITHVVFKDGNDKTLKRVIQSKGKVNCVNVGWVLDCERYQNHMPETSYSIDLGLPTNTPSRTPARFPLSSLDCNTSSPKSIPFNPKTPGTLKFDAELKALQEDRIQTPDFSNLHNESPFVDTSSTPLILKTCPVKQQIDVNNFTTSIQKKNLFSRVRKSLGTGLMMKWDEDVNEQ